MFASHPSIRLGHHGNLLDHVADSHQEYERPTFYDNPNFFTFESGSILSEYFPTWSLVSVPLLPGKSTSTVTIFFFTTYLFRAKERNQKVNDLHHRQNSIVHGKVCL